MLAIYYKINWVPKNGQFCKIVDFVGTWDLVFDYVFTDQLVTVHGRLITRAIGDKSEPSILQNIFFM